MSRLDDLITKLCPDGVEYKMLVDVIDYEQPTKYIVSSTEYSECFKTPVLTAGQRFVLGYTNERSGIYSASKENPVIIFDDFTTSSHWVDFEFKVKSSALKILKPKLSECVKFRFLFHVIKNINYVPEEHARQWITKYSQFRIPIPPLPVQEEIVRILDSFTELTAELTARRKQYEYYRGKLLMFEQTIPRVLLRNVVKQSCSGGTPTKGHVEYYENGTVPWLRTQDVHFNEIYSINSFITEEAVKKTAAKWIPQNCVIVAISGATAGRCAINKIPTTTNQHCLNLEIDDQKALYKFVYYCICAQYDVLLSKKQGARGDLNSNLVLSLEIPLPSIEKQQQIIGILDHFDHLCADIVNGLPAEISARQKQCEYYRDKLLTFKELERA